MEDGTKQLSGNSDVHGGFKEFTNMSWLVVIVETDLTLTSLTADIDNCETITTEIVP